MKFSHDLINLCKQNAISGYMTPVLTLDTGALVIGQVEARVTLTEEAAQGVHTDLLAVVTLQITLVHI